MNGLLSASRNFDEDVYEVLDVFEAFMKDLSDTNQTFSSVMLQLHQFKSQMETCERSISHSKNQQRATEGTISVIESIFSGIERALRDAHDQLSDAENLSRGKINFFILNITDLDRSICSPRRTTIALFSSDGRS